jgi:hypothetical protein
LQTASPDEPLRSGHKDILTVGDATNKLCEMGGVPANDAEQRPARPKKATR